MKFPVFRTVLEVLDYCWRERRLLVRFAALPFILTLILGGAVLAFAAGRTPQEMPGVLIALTLATMLLYLPLTVTWYRIVVLGESEAANRPLFTLGRREVRLLGWNVALLALAFAGGAAGVLVSSFLFRLGASGSIVSAIAGVLWTAAWVIALLLMVMRLTLVYALVAVDQPVNLKVVWTRTAGMGWRLFSAASPC